MSERVQLFPLIDNEQNALGARLLDEQPLYDIAKGCLTLRECACEPVDLEEEINLQHVGLQQGDERRCDRPQRAIARDHGG